MSESTFRASFEGMKLPLNEKSIAMTPPRGPFMLEVFPVTDVYGHVKSWQIRLLPAQHSWREKFKTSTLAMNHAEGLFERRLTSWEECVPAVTVQGGLF